VSLLWGFLNPVPNGASRKFIRDEYKEFHIGYLPVVLAGQVNGKLGEYERTLAAILDAYLQHSMQIELSANVGTAARARLQEAIVDDSEFRRHRRVFRTTASRTFNSGPVSGLMGAHHVAKSLGSKTSS